MKFGEPPDDVREKMEMGQVFQFNAPIDKLPDEYGPGDFDTFAGATDDDEPDEVFIEAIEDNKDVATFVKIAEFRGSIKGVRFMSSGHIRFLLEVPFEDKYLALPISDVRGLLMMFSAYKPVMHGELLEIVERGGG